MTRVSPAIPCTPLAPQRPPSSPPPATLFSSSVLVLHRAAVRPGCELQLPRDNKFPGARTERLGGCLRATVVDAAASKAVLMDSIDAAHCAVHSPPCAAGGLAPHATRFCSVVVKSNTDIGGEISPPAVCALPALPLCFALLLASIGCGLHSAAVHAFCSASGAGHPVPSAHAAKPTQAPTARRARALVTFHPFFQPRAHLAAGGMFGPMVAKGDGDADSDISLVVAQQVVREEWHPHEGTASWLDQVWVPRLV